ncbi:NAD-dependent epimerase/dehydratase family protein [Marinobacter halotolerans]|uniref:NAD-dependent epimerase/dehydratase family protein n=1 Tax=Marinobacter halotolerans TaxID=1569211 RepID=UPI0012479B99|nr:NAD-dependent epimerase/dehydratase family protein [Marinobacter halotolerans]
MKVLLLGATGLTGGMVMDKLLACEQVSCVVAPVRRETGISHPKLAEALVDFDHLEQHQDLFAVDAIICCLGSTIKKAGSRERFRQIDGGIPLKAAELGRQQGVNAFLLMSAVGASSSSPVFYNRVKGELEDALKTLNYPRLSIYQPGLLMTERAEQRLAENLGIKAMPAVNCLLQGPLKRYRGIDAAHVASAMVNEVMLLAEQGAAAPGGVFYHHYDDMVASASSR